MAERFRSIKSFGVAGLLGGDAQIYYQTLTGPGSVGRVSDLIAAKLRSRGALALSRDELTLRLLLIRGSFIGLISRSEAHLITLELGIDSRQIALGVSFSLDSIEAIETIRTALETGSSSDPFTAALLELRQQSGGLILKWQPSHRRIEIDLLLRGDTAEPPETVELPADPDEAPSVDSYAEADELPDVPKDSPKDAPVAKKKSGLMSSVMGAIQKIAKTEEATRNQAEAATRLEEEAPEPVLAENEPEVTEEKIVGDIEQLSKLISEDTEKEQLAIAPIREELKTPAARRLFDQTILDMANERARIKEAAQTMMSHLRQKELKLKSKEQEFARTLKQKDESIRQKTLLLSRAKDQLIRLSKTKQTVRAQDPMVLQRLSQMKNELTASRDQTRKLQAKLDGLLLKQNSQQAQRGNAESEELKRKLANSVKVITAGKRDLERLNSMLREAKRQEAQLKAELKKAQHELQRQKNADKKAA